MGDSGKDGARNGDAGAAGSAPLTRGQLWVLAFTLGYLGLFSLRFLRAGNNEFLWYVLTMAALLALVYRLARRAGLPLALLWALSFWGLAHMAGGGVPVGDTVLYGVVVVPLVSDGDLTILRFDQVVHAYGFGVTAWLVWWLIAAKAPAMARGRGALALAALASMGLGSVNEMVEFAAVLLFPETGVGGYYNTALDLCFNALGALVAVLAIRRFAGAPAPR